MKSIINKLLLGIFSVICMTLILLSVNSKRYRQPNIIYGLEEYGLPMRIQAVLAEPELAAQSPIIPIPIPLP